MGLDDVRIMEKDDRQNIVHNLIKCMLIKLSLKNWIGVSLWSFIPLKGVLTRSLPLAVYALKGCLPPAYAGMTEHLFLFSSPRRRGSRIFIENFY